LIATLPGLASAQVTIDCRIPNVASTFERLRNAGQPFIVVRGTPVFDSSQRPEKPTDSFELPGRFTGTSLGLLGFTKPFNEPVTYRFLCSSFSGETICGSLRSDVESLLFLQKSEAGFTLVAPFCDDSVFQRHLDDHTIMARKCFRGIGCKPNYF
jgi:hypothetical protein